MRRAARELIKARQAHSADLLEQVKVEQIGGWKPKDCFNNSVEFAAKNKERDRYTIVSGWLVGEFIEGANGTPIIQHYWNYDTKKKRYIDVTSNAGAKQTYCYVVDTDLAAYSQQPHIFDTIADCVGHSLWFSDGKFSLVVKPFLKRILISDTTPLSANLFYMDFSGEQHKEVA